MAYIASHNIISSLGFTTEENIKAFYKNVSGIQMTNNPELTPEEVFVSLVNKEEIRSRFSKLANSDQYTDYEKLLILSVDDALSKTGIQADSTDTLFILSTTKGNIDLLSKTKKNHFETNRVQLWKSSEVITEFFKHPNKPITISNACISGTLAIIVAKRLLDAGIYKHAIVTGADILPEFTLSGFAAFKAVSEGPCRPFDKDRTGMTPGEGAGTIILSSDENYSLEKNIHISGGASGNDANHISGPSRTGKELAQTIQNSISEAGLTAEEIDHISAHGTATPYNDEMEAKALTIAGLDKVPVNSMKSYLGHTFGAAGIIETIIAARSIEDSVLFKSLAYEHQGTENALNIIQENRQAAINNVLKTASGFGGCNASLIISSSANIQKENEGKEYSITKKVIIENSSIKIDDTVFMKSDETDFPKFMKSAYIELGIKYPKFYKMDNLCKLAFIASEALLKGEKLNEKYVPEEIALVFSNGSSSLDTDAEYQATIDERDNYFPSPAVFVYTLANIMLGEISIRNTCKGENAVFISEEYDKDFISDYVGLLYNTGNTKACITGRVEFAWPESTYYAELYLTEIKE